MAATHLAQRSIILRSAQQQRDVIETFSCSMHGVMIDFAK
jgi:hypothetical protein